MEIDPRRIPARLSIEGLETKNDCMSQRTGDLLLAEIEQLEAQNKELRWVAERALRYIGQYKPSEDLEHDLRQALGQGDDGA